MAGYVLTREADADIQDIAVQSITNWGFARAQIYVTALHALFERLAAFPDMGRDAGHIRSGYLRMDSGSHAAFYRKTPTGILVVRVLHQRMDFVRHL